MTALALRPYQEEAIDAIRAQYVAGIKSTLLTLPTGCGKTVVFADIARRTVAKGGRVLVLAHRGELLTQALNKLDAIGVDAAIEQADQYAGDAAVVVASVQTMHPRRLAAWPPDTFALIVIDEAHHVTADSYRSILNHFATARVLGVTATPDRLDGDGLGEVFETVAYQYELRAAIADGYLAPIRAERIEVAEIDLDNVKVRTGDFVGSDLANAVSSEAAIHAVVGPLTKLSGDRKTIVFAVDVQHATALAEAINVYKPNSAAVVHGGLPKEQRQQVLADFRDGKVQYLANCALLTEGYDEPAISCVAMVRPTKSRALYTQCVGRGTRLADGKQDLLVLDFAGVTKRHVLIGPKDILASVEQPTGEPDEEQERDGSTRAEERARIERAAVVEFCSVHVDPFIGKVIRPGRQGGGARATEKQLEMLKKSGMTKLPAALGKADASDIIESLVERREAGLATYKQVRFIVQRRIETPEEARQMTFKDACHRIDRVCNPVRREDRGFEA